MIICGDVLDKLKEIESDSVDMTLTSPPYGDLRDYEGYDFNFKGIAKELYRISMPGSVVVWVVGDKCVDGSESGESFRQALYFKEIGFNLHDTMIYMKDGSSYPSNNRYRQVFEYMFVFSNGIPRTFNPIKKINAYPGISRSTARQRGGNTVSYISDVKDEGVAYNVWRYKTGYLKTTKDIFAYEHPAMFPERLVHDHVISWTNPGDLVLDPMCGSGTTCKVAASLNRKYIGIEISERYCEIARQRLGLFA